MTDKPQAQPPDWRDTSGGTRISGTPNKAQPPTEQEVIAAIERLAPHCDYCDLQILIDAYADLSARLAEACKREQEAVARAFNELLAEEVGMEGRAETAIRHILSSPSNWTTEYIVASFKDAILYYMRQRGIAVNEEEQL